MSVNCVNFFGYYSGSFLSDETRRKLKSLGIDPSSVVSEAQAKQMIAQIINVQAVTDVDNSNTTSKNVCNSELEIRTRAKVIASKLGITVSQNQDEEEVLQTLSSKINELISKENSEKLKELNIYQNEVNTLLSEISTIKQNQNSMYAMLNMSANVNKYMLGL